MCGDYSLIKVLNCNQTALYFIETADVEFNYLWLPIYVSVENAHCEDHFKTCIKMSLFRYRSRKTNFRVRFLL